MSIRGTGGFYQTARTVKQPAPVNQSPFTAEVMRPVSSGPQWKKADLGLAEICEKEIVLSPLADSQGLTSFRRVTAALNGRDWRKMQFAGVAMVGANPGADRIGKGVDTLVEVTPTGQFATLNNGPYEIRAGDAVYFGEPYTRDGGLRNVHAARHGDKRLLPSLYPLRRLLPSGVALFQAVADELSHPAPQLNDDSGRPVDFPSCLARALQQLGTVVAADPLQVMQDLLTEEENGSAGQAAQILDDRLPAGFAEDDSRNFLRLIAAYEMLRERASNCLRHRRIGKALNTAKPGEALTMQLSIFGGF